MTAHMFKTPSGEEMVIMPKAEFDRLVLAANENESLRLAEEVLARIESNAEETFPSELVDRLLAQDQPVRALREYRGLTTSALARMSGISRVYLSQIETGERVGTVETLIRIAKALGVDLEMISFSNSRPSTSGESS